MPRRSRRQRDRISQAAAPVLEQVEQRMLFSTINWTNRGGDDGLGMFGGNANLARQIIDRAISDWQNVITDFNNGTNTFTLRVETAAMTSIATGGITQIVNGKPTAGTIKLQNMAGTHWLDPTPQDDAEFTNNITDPYTASAPGVAATDLYATVLHELGHVLGISQEHPTLAIAQYVTDTGIDDPNDANPGNLMAINIGGGPIEATFTNADPGHLW